MLTENNVQNLNI